MASVFQVAVPPRPKRWQIAPAAPSKDLVTSGLPPLIAQVLYNRGVVQPEQIRAFLDPRPALQNPLEPPKLKGLDAAVRRLREAIKRREPVAVYGDYDVDGVTATALLTQTLGALGADVQAYIPDRVDEGYGLNREALKKLHAARVRVVVTVDCGIRSPGEVAFGNELGLDLIVTDHHSVGPELPRALACINAKQVDCPYPFKDLAGVGLAFKLAQALLRIEGRVGGRVAIQEEDLVDLVALGTVADLAPLAGENRTLVRLGLERLNQAGPNPTSWVQARPGIAALIQVSGAKPGAIDAGAIGFLLGPRLNAAGRIEHAMAAYRLLATRDAAEASNLANELNQRNRERQQLTRETQNKARELALACAPDAPLLFAADPGFRAGVVGLAASRLTEEFYRPAIVVEQGEAESRGSCRSIPEFHITDALDQCAELLVRHGGHSVAAGFTVPTARLQELRERLLAIAAEQLGGRDLAPTLGIDAEANPADLSWDLCRYLRQLEPCGYGNPAAVFMTRNLRVREARPVGAEGTHLRLILADERNVTWEAIAFRQSHHMAWLRRDARVDVAYQLEANEWNGSERMQLNVRDLRPAGT